MSLEFDIRRTIILSKYILAWGMPEHRQVMSKEDDANAVELYTFPGKGIFRYATVGLSSHSINESTKCCSEVVFVISEDSNKVGSTVISNYLFNIAAYLISRFGRNLRSEDLIPESPLAPNGWPAAILFDEPRGESEELSCFHVGAQHVKLFWLVPIYQSEYKLIKSEGIDSFDNAVKKAKVSVINMGRIPCA